jgi:hypothetical protein
MEVNGSTQSKIPQSVFISPGKCLGIFVHGWRIALDLHLSPWSTSRIVEVGYGTFALNSMALGILVNLVL